MPSPRKSTPARLSPTDPETLAARLVSDLSPDQELQLAVAKKGIGKIVAMLRVTHTAAREFIDALRPVEPRFYNRPSLATLRRLGPGVCIEFGNCAIFTNPAHDLATEIFWAIDTEDQLASMINSLTPLVSRDEQQEIARRRSALAGYIEWELTKPPKT